MKTRAETVAFVMSQLASRYECSRNKGTRNYQRHHYGVQELRELMDFVYEGQPASDAELIASRTTKYDR